MRGKREQIKRLLYLLAFLTKESAVTLPGILLLLDSSREDLRVKDLGRYLARRWPLYGGMVLTAAQVLLGRRLVLGSVADPFAPLGAGNRPKRLYWGGLCVDPAAGETGTKSFVMSTPYSRQALYIF